MSQLRLDYDRLKRCGDVELSTFLLTVCDQDTVRRAQSAFPEYFTSDPATTPVPDYMLQQRHESCQLMQGWEEILAWFGYTPRIFEYVIGEPVVSELTPTPDGYQPQADPDYMGLNSPNPITFQALWLNVENKQTELCEYLVLSEKLCNDTQSYLVYAMPVECLDRRQDIWNPQ